MYNKSQTREQLLEKKRLYYARNKAKILAIQKAYYADNREAAIARQKEYRKKNIHAIREKDRNRSINKPGKSEYFKKYYRENSVRLKKAARVYHQKNKDRQIALAKEYQKNHAAEIKEFKRNYYQKFKRIIVSKQNTKSRQRRAADPAYATLARLRARLGMALRSAKAKKQDRTLGLIGCSIPFLMKYLQSKFLPGMNWNNRKLWHIDHIRPCASFDLLDTEQQKQCFHYTNLQPLWAADNIRKSDKYEPLETKQNEHR